MRYALEARHDSYRSPACLSLLREHGVALVVSDGAGTWPLIEEITADLVYVRLHGHARLYGGGYSDELLAGWADKVRAWSAQGEDVYVYFDNDSDGRAPYDAQRLAEMLNLLPSRSDEAGDRRR
jgi:uncharacterized protein YecE (DUF72 family)